MTILEVASTYPLLEYTTQLNDCLWSVCFKIYGSDDLLYRRILMELNYRLDWDNLQPLTVIKYIGKTKTSLISEVDI